MFATATSSANVSRHGSALPKSNLFAQNRQIQPRIIGGADAQVGRYPYMVGLLSNSGFHACGGVLVAKDIVLTAAHCT